MKLLLCVPDGSYTRDFVFVEDVVEACYRLMEQLLGNPEILRGRVFNVGTGTSLSIKELADLIRPQQDHIYRDPRPNDMAHQQVGEFLVAHNILSQADVRQLHEAIGWSPKTSLQSWIRLL